MTEPVMTIHEVAELWGVSPHSVKRICADNGVQPVRGYLTSEILAIDYVKRAGQGRRTDLENPMYTVTFSAPQQAEWLAAMPQLAGNGHRVQVDGRQITLSEKALAVLSREADDNDGHFDGEHIWIGGTEYAVTYLEKKEN